MTRASNSLTRYIFLGMAAGLLVGWLWPDFAQNLKPLSTVFIRLIKSLIAPLIFSTLVVGIAGHGNLRQVGRMGLKAIVYFEILTTLALIVGLIAVNTVRPGAGVSLHGDGAVSEIIAHKQTFSDVVTHIVPQSIVQAAAEGEVLQIVVFALLFSLGLAAIPDAKRLVVINICDAIAETMFKVAGIVMLYAPIGVGAAIAVTVGSKGIHVLFGLGTLIVTMYVASVLCILLVLFPALPLMGIPVKPFYRAVREPFLIGFSTASSEAALPLALENMELFGVPKHIVGFVIPTGYSFNLVGSALYLSLASVFVVQAAGKSMSLGEQLVMMLTLMLTSKGVAGVPRAALVILAGTLATFQLPMEGVAVLLGVDALLDMARTSINVLGNCLASAVIARWEGVKVG
ncbi:MAG TPA: cation:dicarboxylase symporter family transporter [Bacteroidota bacterium]|nr:cation:dicarboxylase symporter family transporter [Bacteroidota bacterium]